MHSQHKKERFKALRRIVVKLGSSVVTTPSGVHHERLGRTVAELARLCADGLEVIVVTSGARAAGLARLGLSTLPKTIPEQQAAAAVGQIRLMAMFERFFADHDRHIGQMLVTAADLRDRSRYLNAKHTLDHLLAHGVVPVINENDSVAVEELKFGDNDHLSALVAGLAGADLLVILTDVDGLYDADPSKPGACLVSVVEDVDGLVVPGASSSSGLLGTGGMASKIGAARSACHRGIATIIANGVSAGSLARVMDSEQSEGTLFLPSESPLSQRQHWIAYGIPLGGSLVLDQGAVQAVTMRGGSLLAAGITAVRGKFRTGECVGLLDGDGREFARGLVAYDDEDCRRIHGKASSEIADVLGYHVADEVIHRDDLVLLSEIGESGLKKP